MPKHERLVGHSLMAKRAASKGAALVFVISIISSAQVRAQSKLANSAWPAFRQNALMTAFTPAAGAALPSVKWRANFGSGPLGSPVLAADGTIYVPGNADSALYAVTPDGILKWVFAGKDTEKFVAPVIIGEDGTIYFGSTTNIFYAINSNGSLRWRLKLDGPVRFSANIGSDGTIYVAAQDCNLYAITPTGQLKWRIFLGKLPGNGPAIATDGTIYVVAGEFLKGVKPDGTLRFEFSNADMGVLNGLMVEGKELFYVTSLEKPFIRAISNTPAIRWEKTLNSSFKGSVMPAMGKDGTIYFATVEDGGVVALDHSGSQRWLFSLSGAKNLTELVVDDSNCVYIVNDKLGLTSLSANGKLRWSLAEVKCAFSPAIGADGTIYVASDRKLYAIGPQQPRAASLLKLSQNLAACVGTPLADTIRVRVLDQYGNVFPGQTVQFRVLSGGGAVTVLNEITDAHGIARALWQLGLAPGNQELEVSATGLSGSPAIFTATAKTPQISGNNEAVFDFPEINQASEKFYTIHNNSECTLRVESLAILNDIAGSFSIITTGFPREIASGDSLPVRLRFGPTACNLQTATLRILSDDPNRSPFDVSLRGAAATRPDIALTTAPLNFGTICRQTSTIRSLSISNAGCSDLTITGITSTNPAFSVVNPLPVGIPPGSQTLLNIRFSPTAILGYNATLSIFSNDADESVVTVPLSGNGGVADIDGLAEAIFDEVEIQSCAGISNADTVMYVLSNLGVCDLNVDTLFTNTQVFSVVPPNANLMISAGGSLTIKLRFAPSAQGNYSGILKILSDDPNDPELEVALRGTGVTQPDIDATPLVLDFGNVKLSSSLRKSIAIRNLGAAPLAVQRFVVAPSPPFAAESKEFSLNCNESDSIVVAFTPVASGLVEGKLEIFSNDPNESPFVVKLRGNGSGPDIAVEPDTLDFGAVCGGEDSLKFVTLRNDGDETLIVQSLTFLPPVFSTTQTTPFSVPPGGSVQIPVKYVYVERREDTGTLTISSNDPDEPEVTVVLHGKGKAPDIELVTPDSVTVCIGGITPTPICVFNPSDCTLPFDTDSIEIIIISGSGVLSKVVERSIPTFTAKSPILIKPKEQFCLNVNVRGLQVGNLTLEVILKSNIPGKTRITRFIPVTVVPAEIAGVERVDFGGVEILTSLEKPAPVWNDGECVVQIDSLRITGADAAAFAIDTFSLPHTINAGDTADIPIVFNPTRMGSYTATLLVYNNDGTRNPLPIILTGVGTSTTGSCDPIIAVQPTALQFGDVIEKRSLTKFAIVTNTGRCELVISVLKVVGRDSLAFVASASGLPLTLAQQDSDSLIVTFTPPSPGSFMATLLVFNSDTTNNPLEIALMGVGVECPPVISVNPDSLPFGQVALGDTLAKTITVSNTSDCATLHVSNIVANMTTVFFVNLADRQFDLAPSSSRDIKVYFVPVATVLYSDSLKIASDDPANSLVIVPLSGEGKLPYTVTPSPVIFPQTCVGSESFADVTICNIGGFDLIASPITTAGPQFREEVDDLLIPTGSDSCRTIRISFLPDKVGAFHDTLTVVWDPSLNLPPLKVPLSGQGIGPQIAGNKTLSFGDVGVGNTSAKSDTVFNNSLCILRLDSLKIMGANASDFHLVNFNPNNLPSNINPNGSLILSLEFAPQELGEKTAELYVWSNDPDAADNPFVVQLHGNGVTGVLSACDNIDFGKTCVDNPVTKECTFANTSKIADLEVSSMRLASGSDFHLGSVSLPARVKPDSAITISIIFAPVKTGDKRPAQDTVFISTKFSEQEHRITLFGQKRSDAPDIVLNTLSLEFQSPVGVKTDCQAAEITNEGCSPLEVSDLKLAGYTTNVFEICPGLPTPFTLMLGDIPRPVNVFFKPIDFKEFKDELRIYNDDPGKNPVTVALIGRVPSGDEVCLKSDSAQIRFGSMFIKTEKTARLGVTNCSNPAALIRVEASLTSGRDFVVAPDSLPNITPNAKQYLNITFRPMKTGERSDTLKLVVSSVFDANVRTELKIILYGTGIDDEVFALPNAFTPNDDNKNDFAKVHFPGYKMVSPVLRIYDLRGIAVRVLRRAIGGGDEIAWDGYEDESRSRLMPPGAYVWLLEDQGKKVGSGMIVLIR